MVSLFIHSDRVLKKKNFFFLKKKNYSAMANERHAKTKMVE